MPVAQPRFNMQRVTADGSAADLANGGTVASSFLGDSDLAVRVTIDNQPTYFSRMELVENPAVSLLGRSFVNSPRTRMSL